MKNFFNATVFGAMTIVALCSIADGQLYTGWSHYQDFLMNPSATGITTNPVNFPVLLRLTSAVASVWSDTIGIGANKCPNDLRFAKGSNLNTGYSFQVQRWDATHQLAEVWILVDTVFSTSTAQDLRMYWGNGSAAAASSGPSVFSPANNFVAVWHGSDTSDATGNGYTLAKSSTGIVKTAGLIDSCYLLTGSASSVLSITGTASTMGSPATLFLSCWANVTGTASNQNLIQIASSPGLRAGDGTSSDNCMYYISGTGTGTSNDWATGPVMSGKGWTYVGGLFNPSGPVESYYFNDTIPKSLTVAKGTMGTNAGAIDYGVTTIDSTVLGGLSNMGTGYFLTGSLNEVRVEKTVRSADWIKLCYLNQGAGQTFIQANPLPTAPALVSPTNNAVNQTYPTLSLSWTSGSGSAVSTYEIQVSTGAGFSSTVFDFPGLTGSATTQALSSLSSATIYYWRIDATGSTGTGAWSSVWSFTTATPWAPPPLATPTTGTINLSLSPALTWVAVSNASSYEVQVSTSPAFGSTFLDQTGVTGNSLNITGLSNYTQYYWEVQAYGTGQTPDPTGWSGVWSFTTIIGAPTLASPTNGATNQPVSLSLNWGSLPGAALYALSVSTSSTFGTTVFSQAGLTGIYQAVTGLPPSSTCYWKVIATGANGGTGAWSAVWSFTTVPPPPAQPALAEPENGFKSIPLQPNLTWNTVATATSYELELSASATFASTLYDAAGLTGHSYVPSSVLAYNSLYYWQVRATNGGGTGNWATARSFTTAENYGGGWTYHKPITLNTKAAGWTAAGQIETNFPVLIRLTTANFSGFGQVNYQATPGWAIDIRFSGSNYAKSFPYQVDSWSGTGDSANIWVLVDTLFSNDSTHSIVMHYGNGSAADMSSGAQVFDTGNGYQAVYHFSEATAGNVTDATINSYSGTNVGTPPPTVVPGVIGSARSFNGTSQAFYMPNTATIQPGTQPGSPT